MSCKRGPRYFTTEQKEFFRQKIAEGLINKVKHTELAEYIGVSRSTLTKFIKEFNLKTLKVLETPNKGDMVGEGDFIEEFRQIRKDGRLEKRWICKCKCGLIWNVMPFNVIRGSNCKTCRSKKISEKQWDGYGEISKSYWSAIQKSAFKRNKEFKISIEYAWDIFLQQNKICALTGIELFFPARLDYIKNKNTQTASLDRIDNSKGYLEGNVRWIHKDVNYIRRDLNDEEFLFYIEKIYYYKIKGQ